MEARGTKAGERKTITALFADMAGSTALIHSMDPEDARRLIDPVVELMMEAVHHYDGYVAKSLGDGILALFGAPLAHEDHAQRAVYAALRMQDAMRRHSDQIHLNVGTPLQIRVGIHTGEVVVRSICRDDLRTDYDPVGHTIHIASRMENIAAPSAILVSESTYRLTEGYLDFKALGATQVKGIPQPLMVYEVLGLGASRTRLQVSERRGLARFVGRQDELKQLRQALDRAETGQGQVVGVIGDAGVGKSRLFHEFKEQTRGCSLILETFSVSHGKSFAYLPLIELVKNYFQISDHDDERICREKIAGRLLSLARSLEEQLPYLLYLLGFIEPGSALPNMDPEIRRQRIFDAITEVLLRESTNQPVEILFEDLQWLDSETEAFLNVLIERLPSARILLLLNYRPEYQHGWGHKPYYTPLRLEPLGPAEAQRLLTALLRDEPQIISLKELILEKTEGNPFFMEEVVQTLAEEKVLRGQPGHFYTERTPNVLHIPTTVQGVLTARIDRLPYAEKKLLQTLAVIGKEFPLSLIQQIVEEPDAKLRHLLARLQTREFIYERPSFPDIGFSFKHALTQEVASSSLLIEQRTALHERTALAIEALFHGRLNDYWAELARHYSLSRNHLKAVEYLHRTAQQALQRSAYTEAIRHVSTALDFVKNFPETTERARQELSLHLVIGPALIAAKGFASSEVEATYSRALDLCEQVGETPQLFETLVGLRTYFSLHADHAKALEVGKRMLGIAENAHDPELLGEANVSLGSTLFFQGEFSTAHAHLNQARLLYTSEPRHAHFTSQGADPEVRAYVMLAQVLWCLGYPDQARGRAKEALDLAQKLEHPFTLAHALVSLAQLHQFHRDAESTQKFADSAIALSREMGFPLWLAWASILNGWALAIKGSVEEGVSQVRAGLTAYHATGANLGQPHFLAILADTHANTGRPRAALRVLENAFTWAEKTGERYYEAELQRLKGELILRESMARSREAWDLDVALSCFNKAIAIARQQNAKWLELRATLGLARIWQLQGKVAAAMRRLTEIKGTLTEGFDTVDWARATTLTED
ncbi:hypothetical protein LMG26411_04568 [Cupriavidus numazuensis]|uniref:Guanylate cyclase domain-containing protein n=2 Tax=Cupriavidus numazuensis TaxID=221992 RepID=A0ABM8TMF4_9BURK|nr:hypothetical protein LMG26411_04568 [Cupriavidus numazuensis]